MIKNLELLAKSQQAYLASHKQLIDHELGRLLDAPGASQHFKNLDGSLKHTVLLNGKRLRPILAMAVYEMYRDDIETIITPACAIELIHAGSLMLDDLPCMDDAEYRRGEKTNHLLFGESVTILASAALWVYAFEILSNIKDTKINDLVRYTAQCIGKNGLILGQFMDLFAFHKKQTIEDLLKCYSLKTSSLVTLAIRYGAILGEASKSEQEALNHFGEAFGIAFQIHDDIMDATLTKKDTGKDAHKDQDNGKPNYVSQLGLAKAREALKVETLKAQRQLDGIDRDTSKLEMILNYVTA